MSEQPPSAAHRGGTTSGVDRSIIIGGVVLVLGLFGTGTALAFAGWKPESIVGMVTGLGTVAGVLLGALAKLGTLQSRVDDVAHQTNGELRKYVAQETSAQVRQALTDHGLPAQAPPRPRRRAAS